MDVPTGIALSALACVICLGSAPPGPDQDADAAQPLAVAQRLADTRFHGFTYGKSAARKQVDCVLFLQAVLEELLGRRLSEAEARAVIIDYRFDDLGAAVANRDPRTKGVVRAVSETIACGKEISAREARPGDFIQYWYKSAAGKWLGHASIISRVWSPGEGDVRAAIFGSHKSKNRICENDFGGEGLCLTKPGRLVYLARFQPPRKETGLKAD